MRCGLFFLLLMDNSLKYFHYTVLQNTVPSLNNSFSFDDFTRLIGKKIIKIRIRQKMVYTVEINYYPKLALIKFYPKIFEDHDDKYKKIGMGLTYTEKRKLLNTCCRIVRDEMSSQRIAYGFFGQCYEKDDLKNRVTSKRFEWYAKQAAIFFSTDNYNHVILEKINFCCVSNVEDAEFDFEKLIVTLESEGWIEDFMTERMKVKYRSRIEV